MSAFIPDGPALTSVVDQLQAACREVAGLPWAAEVAGIGTQVLPAPAWLLKLMDSVLTDGQPILRCEDWSWSAPRPAVASLTDLHVIRCLDHVDDLPGMVESYPTTCDRCRRPHVGVHAVSYLLPPLMVLATLCTNCSKATV